MNDLVQIEPKKIPPLHQSTEAVMSCPVFYVEAIIRRRRKPGGMESARGNQVHDVWARYSSHCAEHGIAMDLDEFDRLAQGAGPLAAKILSGMRDNYAVDYEHLLATEISFSLDEELNPTQVPEKAQSEVNDSGEYPAYQGTIDTLLAFRSELKIQIDDAKSHPRPFDPDDTLQGKMYSVFAFLHFPWVQQVKFRLVFVRYRNLIREVVYDRSDLPKLIETIKAARARQELIHSMFESGDKMEAIPGPHCTYCPLLSNRQCPIAEFNEQMQLTPSDRLKFHIWYSAFSAANNKVLKEIVQGTGRNIVLRDFNGKIYSYGPVPKESLVYPLFQKTENSIAFRCMDCGHISPRAVENGACPRCRKMMIPVMPIVSLIEDHANGNPDDTAWMGNILISSTKLNGYLDTKDRAILDQAVTDTAERIPKVTLKVSKPLDRLEDEDPEPRSDEWGEDDEF